MNAVEASLQSTEARQRLNDRIAESVPGDEEDAAPIVKRLLVGTRSGLIDWRRGDYLTLLADVGDVHFHLYTTLSVGDANTTWRQFNIDIGPLRAAVIVYLERPVAAPTARAITALDTLLNEGR